MAKAGDKSGGRVKKGLKRKATAEEPQETAVAEDGATESGVQPPKAAAFPPGFSISEIKNKQRRHLMFTRWKQQQRKEKLAIKKKLKKEREALGDKAPPKPIPKTIDNQRVYDETVVDPNDEECGAGALARTMTGVGQGTPSTCSGCVGKSVLERGLKGFANVSHEGWTAIMEDFQVWSGPFWMRVGTQTEAQV
ncbi:hypothetical protein PANDA_016573 [Ailuropoda melanoleuca]|uniref:Uncharacterized protein n=1 Tax=Ailuropoda melanoleuca TaxID=9646 RepID=D2HVX6_AILME|nr:hypothetical protein PANDA_016573 [Ailuropoda melanoleuca]